MLVLYTMAESTVGSIDRWIGTVTTEEMTKQKIQFNKPLSVQSDTWMICTRGACIYVLLLLLTDIWSECTDVSRKIAWYF